MGRNKKSSLGKALLKEQRHKSGRKSGDSWLHTSDLQDGYDWGRLNLQSVTEQNTLDDFLTTAELAGKEFTAEKMNVKIVTPTANSGVLNPEEEKTIKKMHDDNRHFITVPRRPKWDENTTAEALQLQERDSFLAWRRQLALMQEKDDKLILTPYEKNLDVWRQLWRVIERSDVICQIVDARNPLLFKCNDLSTYVTELDSGKDNILIVNKADLLTEKQRSLWAEYFTSMGIQFVFWSALKETLSQDKEISEELSEKLALSDESEDSSDENDDEEPSLEPETQLPDDQQRTAAKTEGEVSTETSDKPELSCSCGSIDIFDRPRLLSLFQNLKKADKDRITVGLVGYPNVGKSSTINALMHDKKTAVSATPGKTKHFQTLFPEENTCLCDCPGLVFPNFVSTKAEMVVNGILPIDQLRDHIPPVTLVCRLIPRHVLERTYGVNIPRPGEDEDQDRYPTADEFLSSYASMRGFMTSHGMPDCPRASRYILKDFVNSKLLYCVPPPGVSDGDFEPCALANDVAKDSARYAQLEVRMHVPKKSSAKVDQDFFADEKSAAHFNAPAGIRNPQELTPEERRAMKPWRKHHNRNKREKLRRIYKD